MKSLLWLIILVSVLNNSFAQCILYNTVNFRGLVNVRGWGYHSLESTAERKIRSIQLEEGAIAVFFERSEFGIPAGKHWIVTSTKVDIQLGYLPACLMVINNPGNNFVVAFEHNGLKGRSHLFSEGINAIPDDFGISSLYIPEGIKLLMSGINPDLRVDYGGPTRLFNSGVHLSIGDKVNDLKGFAKVIIETNNSNHFSPSPVLAPPVKITSMKVLMDKKASEFANPLGNLISTDSSALPIDKTNWFYRQYSRGVIYGSHEKGVFAVTGRIFYEYVKNNKGLFGVLGMPASDVFENANFRICIFENGVIIENKAGTDIKVYHGSSK